MTKVLLLCLISAACFLCASACKPEYYRTEEAKQLFEDFILTHGKNYSNEHEKQKRLQIFTENLKTINNKNSLGGAVFGINYFSDLSIKEFESIYTCLRPSSKVQDTCKVITDNDITTNQAPQSLNWLDKGAVTPVKNQQNCGSCWAFSTIGSIEGQHFIKNQKLVGFSEQQLVDCSRRNQGCSGGFMSDAMTDLMELGGLQSEATYPYNAQVDQCKFDKSKAETKITGCTRYALESEDKLKEVLATKGPISVGLFAQDIMMYKGGVIKGDDCMSRTGGHAVLLVGYGTTDQGVDYWLLKNSWSDQWGENGYFRLTRNENTCSIMKYDNFYENTSPDL